MIIPGKKSKRPVSFASIFLFFAAVTAIYLFPVEGGNVRTFILNKSHLKLGKEMWKSGDRHFVRNVERLRRTAEKALKKGPYSVTFKKYPHPGGDQHDFLAYGAYYWPNPNTKDGLPWAARDGFSNPDAAVDWKEFNPMARESWLLALAYYFTGNEAYASHSALLLRTWFIDEKTRMNPRVEYGKVIPGVTEGGYSVAGFGYGFRQVYDAAGILESSPSWSEVDKVALQDWTRKFLEWSETSPYGKAEYYSKSNHSTFFHMIAALQAMYIGDDVKARAFLKNYIHERIQSHFKPDGTQPFEMIRANNFDYHRCNLEVALDIAALADHYSDIDAWGFKTKDGSGLRRSIEFLVPFFTEEKKWPYFKKHKFTIPKHYRARLLRRAAIAYGDLSFEKSVKKIAPTYGMYLIDLCYPGMAIPKQKQ